MNLISFTILLTLKPSRCFNLKLEELSYKEGQELALLNNCYTDIFTEVETC